MTLICSEGHNALQYFETFLKYIVYSTDCRHMKAKYLILCGPNSNPYPKYLKSGYKGLFFVEIMV